MAGFSARVQEAVQATDAQARQLEGSIGEAARHSRDLVAGQFEALRSQAAQARQEAAEELHGLYEQAVADVGAMFGKTLERFRQSSTEVRGMAAALQRELATTREDLKRVTLDLPRETAEQARQVRSVLDEQVRTLASLTDLLGRVSPGFDPAATQRATPAAGRDVAPQPFDLRPSGPAPRQPAPGGRNRTSTASTRPAPAERNAGWLSDLLARASEEEPAPEAPEPSAAGGEALSDLSFDVTQLIHADALADAWDRYRRGDNNAFGRRLYTAAGQHTFEEIRRRFRTDEEFSNTVTRYAEEFERMLRELEPKDRNGTLARSYLLSDTGKVYTMLAHAAGRLD